MPPTGPRTGSGRFRGAALLHFDRALGASLVAGADEAGRGSLAGPLFGAAVLFDYRRLAGAGEAALRALDDSKRHRPATREALFRAVLAQAAAVAVVAVPVSELEALGLQRANLLALERALAAVCRESDEQPLCLVDGFALDGPLPHRPLRGGDRQSAAIAAASIVAKVLRDRHMARAARRYPNWGFERHAGYGTVAHREAIRRFGPSPLHRLHFRVAEYGLAAGAGC